MDCLDLSLPSPEENLALDEALLEAAEAGECPETLRFWESDRHFVVLGAGCRAREDVLLATCRAEAMPVLRRCTGGGTVVQGPGCLNFALVLDQSARPELATIQSTNSAILSQAADALTRHDPRIAHRGISDLASAEKKVTGTAQKRKKQFILFHGTLLHHLDLTLIPRYLREPVKQPDYREQRPHSDFIANLGLDPAVLRQALRAAFAPARDARNWPVQRVSELIRAKYSRDEHNLSL